MSASPGAGCRLKSPNRVQMMLAGLLAPEHATPAGANEGRSVNCPSRFVSAPVMMLKGAPDDAKIRGFRVTCHQGRLSEPPRKSRWRISKPLRPYSPCRSYGFAENDDEP